MKKSGAGILILLIITVSFSFHLNAEENYIEASIKPISLIVQSITKNSIPTKTIVPPGVSPHTFSLTVRKTNELFKAKAVVFVGGDIEFWAKDIKNEIGDKRLFIITKYTQPLIKGYSGVINPHVWLSPKRILKALPYLKNFLINNFPEKRASIESGYRMFRKNLESLSLKMEQFFLKLQNKNVISYHSAWSYFFKDYTLNEIDVIEKKAGEPPSIKRIIEIKNKIKKYHIKFIVVEPNVSIKLIKSIIEGTTAKFITLDPLGYEKGIKTYTNLIERNFEKIKKGLYE